MVYRKEGSSQIELVTGSENFADITPDDTFFPLQIDRILPDAQGKDDNNEQVVITLLSGDAFDLQQVVLVSNGKKSPLHGLVESGQTLVFKGSFGLLNKPSCVSLHYQQTTLDEFCY